MLVSLVARHDFSIFNGEVRFVVFVKIVHSQMLVWNCPFLTHGLMFNCSRCQTLTSKYLIFCMFTVCLFVLKNIFSKKCFSLNSIKILSLPAIKSWRAVLKRTFFVLQAMLRTRQDENILHVRQRHRQRNYKDNDMTDVYLRFILAKAHNSRVLSQCFKHCGAS